MEINKERTAESVLSFGTDVFSDALMKERLRPETYTALRHTIEGGGGLTLAVAGEVAEALMEWALEKGATHYTHWFQPMTGATAEKRDSFLSPAELDGTPIFKFSAKALIKGEADGSSLPSGGLRATFEARGYTTWDCTSPAFIKHSPDGTACLCIPTAFCAFNGEALDEKTPLLRSMDALNREALRVLRALGDDATTRVVPTVGAEQEYFLIDKETFFKRKDLVYTGTTLFGAQPSKGQELSDQYYAATPEKVISFMHELNSELWRMGVPAKTEHNEAAPAQYELAQLFASANVAVDQNQIVMEMMRRIAERHDLICLLHEKPFFNVNGSGKHNNWSLSTNDGKNLLKPPKQGEDRKLWYTFMMAVIAAVDEYAPLLRMSCASASNEKRLGGNEAPPQIISVFLGTGVKRELERFVYGESAEEAPSELMHIGVSSLADIKRDDTDRNRTSPFAFTGDKFEFRMVGSSQSLGLPNTVLNTIMAEELSRIADELEASAAGEKTWEEMIRRMYLEHGRVVFNGNNYGSAWMLEAKRRGLPVIDNTVDAFGVFVSKEAKEVFTKHGVFNENELAARCEIAQQNYATAGLIEATTMQKVCRQSILPAAAKYSAVLADSVTACLQAGIDAPAQTAMLRELNRRMNDVRVKLENLDSVLVKLPEKGDSEKLACAYRDKILPRMAALRRETDKLETVVDKAYWPLPSYGEMLFRVQKYR